jgi:hypothetical protein
MLGFSSPKFRLPIVIEGSLWLHHSRKRATWASDVDKIFGLAFHPLRSVWRHTFRYSGLLRMCGSGTQTRSSMIVAVVVFDCCP